MEARAAARPEAPPDCPLYPRLLTFRLAGYALLGQSLLLAQSGPHSSRRKLPLLTQSGYPGAPKLIDVCDAEEENSSVASQCDGGHEWDQAEYTTVS
jgi:hypothetical protein